MWGNLPVHIISFSFDLVYMRGYMDRRVTPPEWVTSLTWGLLPPSKQAFSVKDFEVD